MTGIYNWSYDEEVETLKQLYKQHDLDLTKQQCYDLWKKYSAQCHAGWLNVNRDTNVVNSIDLLRDVGVYVRRLHVKEG